MTDGDVGSSAWFGDRTGSIEDGDEPRAFPRMDSRCILFLRSATGFESLLAYSRQSLHETFEVHTETLWLLPNVKDEPRPQRAGRVQEIDTRKDSIRRKK